jgi:glutamate-1-semialdehyde 2,1-aminomutase
MAAGLATLRHLREHPEIYLQLDQKSAALVEGVLAVAKEQGVALCANRVGSMFTWFFQKGPVHDWDTAAKSDTKAFGRFHKVMLDRGIYLPPSQFEAMFLSAAHSDGDIHRTIEAASHAFGD